MRITGELISEARTLEGDRTVTFKISEDKDLTEYQGKKISLDIPPLLRKGPGRPQTHIFSWFLHLPHPSDLQVPMFSSPALFILALVGKWLRLFWQGSRTKVCTGK